MADKVSSSKELKLELYFQDGDTRTIAVDNPKANLTAAQINALGTLIKNSKVLLGDKGGADPVKFNSPARIIEKDVVSLDLR